MAINLRGASYKNGVLTHSDMDNNFLSFLTVDGTGPNRSVTTIFAPNFDSTSDKRLKENIEPIKNAIDKIENLNGYTFNFKEDTGKTKRSGVIAQECLDAFPEVVSERNGFYNVSYDGLVPLLLEAIKEQQRQIDALKKQLDSM